MRTRNAFINMSSSLLSHFTSILLGFISQAIFIKYLGTEFLGINGLFNNIFSMLGVVELGIGSSIIYHLYKPIAKKDQESINTLMTFYKKCYRVIALIILILSLILFPFLKIIVGETTVNFNLVNIIYILFIIDIVCSYLLTYKRSILYASQQNYIIDFIHIIYLIILNGVQISIMLIKKDYILYLIVKIIMRLTENIIITHYVNKHYSYLKNTGKKLSDELKKDILNKVKGLFLHKIGVFFVAGTDNIIISSFLGVASVGLYSNYNVIISAINNLILQIFSSFKSSIGNLIVTNEKDRVYLVYKRMQFLNFWFAMMSSIGILIVMESFITIWIGEQYILSKTVLITLSIYNYIYITKLCTSNFKEAAGIFYEDRYIPIIESIVNIVLSIILVTKFGLAGVFMGTICCHLITHIYTYPKIVYKKVFNKEYKRYFLDNIKYLIITLIIAFPIYYISSILFLDNNLLNLLKDLALVIIIPNVIVIIFFKKTDEFKYYKNILEKNIFQKMKQLLKNKKSKKEKKITICAKI